MIEEIEHDDSQAGADDVQVVRPSPPGCGIGRKLLCNDGSEAGDLEGGREDRSYPNRTVFVGDQLGNRDGERDLHGSSKTTKDVAPDHGIDILSGCRDDGADEGESIAANEEPTTAENVGESANKEETDGETEGVGDRNPC